MANAPIVVAEGEEDLEVDYDSDGYPILPERSKVRYNLPLGSISLLSSVIIATQVIDPLPPIDHSAVSHRMLLHYQLYLYPSLWCLPLLMPTTHMHPPHIPTHTHAHTHTHTYAHSQIDYPSFGRDFYEEHSEISVLTAAEVRDLRKKMGLRVNYQLPGCST